MAVIGMVYGIDYCLLDSLFYTPSTFSISQSLREVVRRRKFALVSRSSAVRHLLKAIGWLPHVDRDPLPAALALLHRPVASSVSACSRGHIEPSSSRRRMIVIGVVALVSSLVGGRRSSPVHA